MRKIREIKFNGKILKFVYRDDSDQSVIDEFFVDRMYRSIEFSILNSPARHASQLAGVAGRQFLILDIGAHIGVFSVYSSILNPKSPILALEPEPTNFELLKANLKLNNCQNVAPINAALVPGDELNTKLYLSKNTHNHSTTKPINQSTQITVPAINLAHLMKEYKIKKIGLLKMDIEGAEFEIIQNIKHGTWSKIQCMVVEYHESNNRKRLELETLIREHGFSVEHFPNKFDKRFGLLVCRNKR